ncbi:hypothetical protein [Streptomyces sp. NPDC005435]|uniref:hypothetical protein n=1 Tax=Streptomyces sp. NPDC005435 TaxID=3154464 RepID=UPI003455EDEA
MQHGAVGDGDQWPAAAGGGQGPYGHPQAHSYGPPAPPAPPRRGAPSTVLLVVVALVVALGAGGSVYALLQEGRPTAAPPVDAEPEESVPAAYVGTWLAGAHRLTLTEGRVGDTLLTLVTETPAHECVATARLTAVTPGSLRFAAPATHLPTCASGPPATLTLLPGGQLTGGGLTFRRAASPAG